MNYIIEVNIGIAILYGAYLLILRNENDFTKQRLVLLCSAVCAILFPLIELPSGAVEEIALTTMMLPELVVNNNIVASSNNLLIIYMAVSAIIAIPILIHAIKVYMVSKQESGYYRGDYYVVESNDDRPSWSFFRLIYIGRAAELSDEDKTLVLKHEMLHGRLLHSIDMVLITLLCTIFWFNPVWWLYRQTMAKIHEFEVDSIIAQQHGSINYSMLLAKTALSRNGFLLTHHFNQSFILKRINMINMIKNKISTWKLGGLAAVVVIYFGVIACTEPVTENRTAEKLAADNIDKTGEVFSIVEKGAMPVEGITKFYEELGNVLQYPEQARKAGIEGKVYVEFIVNKDGKLSDFKVLKGIGAGCDAAAVKALADMKPWTLPTHEGQVVRQRMVIPINFKLN